MKRTYKIAGLKNNPEYAMMIQDGASKISGIGEATCDTDSECLFVEIEYDHAVITQLIQYVVNKVDSALGLEMTEETE